MWRISDPIWSQRLLGIGFSYDLIEVYPLAS